MIFLSVLFSVESVRGLFIYLLRESNFGFTHLPIFLSYFLKSSSNPSFYFVSYPFRETFWGLIHYYFSVTKSKQEQCLAFESRSVYEYLYLSMNEICTDLVYFCFWGSLYSRYLIILVPVTDFGSYNWFRVLNCLVVSVEWRKPHAMVLHRHCAANWLKPLKA